MTFLRRKTMQLAAGISLFALTTATAQQADSTQVPHEELNVENLIDDDARDNIDLAKSFLYTAYSRQLDSLATVMTGHLAEQGQSPENRFYALHSGDRDLALALDIIPEDLSLFLFGPDVVLKNDAPYLLNAAMAVEATSSFGTSHYDFNPNHIDNGMTENGMGPRVLVPLLDYSNDMVAEKTMIAPFIDHTISQQDFIRFMTLHEIGHGFYEAGTAAIGKAAARLKPGDSKAELVIAHHRDEIFADLYAVGEMIRNGHSTDIIDTIIQLRASSKDEETHEYDIEHMSGIALDALKDKIEKIGLRVFCNIDHETALLLYQDIVDHTALNEADLDQFYKESPVSSMTAKFKDYFNTRAAVYPMDDGLTEAQRENIEDILDDYDAKKEIKDAAFAKDGVITQLTLVDAYGDMQRDLEAKTASDPANAVLYKEKRKALQNAFVEVLESSYFTGDNTERGLSEKDIVEKRSVFMNQFKIPPKEPVTLAATARTAAPFTPK